jgi:hypothetical protein
MNLYDCLFSRSTSFFLVFQREMERQFNAQVAFTAKSHHSKQQSNSFKRSRGIKLAYEFAPCQIKIGLKEKSRLALQRKIRTTGKMRT